jgi:two-component system response regulator/two-component system chemotaxis response regulator CheY
MLPKVLLVEDDEVLREIYSMKFQLEGFDIDTAENGRVGLEKLSQFGPQVVLLDMMMPVMGGIDFLKAIDSSDPALPHIIVFSNMSAAKQIDTVMRLGAKAYWTKADYTPDRCVQEIIQIWRDIAPSE